MYRKVMGAAALALTVAAASTLRADEKTVMVGGAAMYPSNEHHRELAMNSKDHTTLVAVGQGRRAGRHARGQGPVHRLRADQRRVCQAAGGQSIDALLKPENKTMLTKVLTYHVVAGKLDAHALMEKAHKGGGKAELATVSGGKLWVVMDMGKLRLRDEKGMEASITTPDVYQSNGVIHVIDTVVMSKLTTCSGLGARGSGSARGSARARLGTRGLGTRGWGLGTRGWGLGSRSCGLAASGSARRVVVGNEFDRDGASVQVRRS